ncbi:unnamed protein product [Polarella glacialis]|uniref:Uncharacterized protein n=1 Tax=Polarella glacialis TaxID=89957 RepID=A0A813I144_POLGL|nr:unnamed protein product [Polarella glacialis]
MSSRVVLSSASPPVVSQRLSDLLQEFPSAAAGGVQWQTLVRKYEQRHSARLDLESLGHDSPLAAATALLWDVLRIVDAEDTDNPVVAVEDSIAMTPRPLSSASWPSLYAVLCQVVQEHGMEEIEASETRVILVSQLKPLLQSHWHSSFDEGGLSYLTEEGSPIKLKKMKHLLQALLRWREQRVSWQSGSNSRRGALDEALRPRLELAPSTKHNDLVLRCVQPEAAEAIYQGLPVSPSPLALLGSSEKSSSRPQRSGPGKASCPPRTPAPRKAAWSDADDSDISSNVSSGGSAELEQELAALRFENAKLRSQNSFLEQTQAPALPFGTPEPKACQPFIHLVDDVFDNPFEPPPEARSQYWMHMPSPMASTSASSDFGCLSSGGVGTPLSGFSGGSCAHSGTHTPAGYGPPSFGQPSFGHCQGQVCTLVPVGWFAIGERSEIPSGMVQQARAIFERHAVVPSWFQQQ